MAEEGGGRGFSISYILSATFGLMLLGGAEEEGGSVDILFFRLYLSMADRRDQLGRIGSPLTLDLQMGQ